MEFRIKHYKSFANSNGGNVFSEWWIVQKKLLFVWNTFRQPVPHALLKEAVRFETVGKAKAYIDAQLSKPRRFVVTSEIL